MNSSISDNGPEIENRAIVFRPHVILSTDLSLESDHALGRLRPIEKYTSFQYPNNMR